MNHNVIALLMIGVIGVLGALTVVQLNSVSGQVIVDNSINRGMSWRTSTSVVDYGYPAQYVPLVGYQRQISIGKCKLQGTCRGVPGFDSACPAYPLYVNGFLEACVSLQDSLAYPMCSHKAVGGYQGNSACSPLHADWRVRNDCVCL